MISDFSSIPPFSILALYDLIAQRHATVKKSHLLPLRKSLVLRPNSKHGITQLSGIKAQMQRNLTKY